MGATNQFESHRVELPAVLELEYDNSILEYYGQVPAIKLDYRSADGKRLGVLNTADFFVIREDSAGWEECKTDDELKGCRSGTHSAEESRPGTSRTA